MSFVFDTTVYGLEVEVIGDFERPADDAPLAFLVESVTHCGFEMDVADFPAELHEQLNREALAKVEEDRDYE